MIILDICVIKYAEDYTEVVMHSSIFCTCRIFKKLINWEILLPEF